MSELPRTGVKVEIFATGAAVSHTLRIVLLAALGWPVSAVNASCATDTRTIALGADATITTWKIFHVPSHVPHSGSPVPADEKQLRQGPVDEWMLSDEHARASHYTIPSKHQQRSMLAPIGCSHNQDSILNIRQVVNRPVQQAHHRLSPQTTDQTHF